jgi:hypothetical protein
MENITIASEQRKDLIIRMKREGKPGRRLRMHIVLLASKGYSPTGGGEVPCRWSTTQPKN